MLNLIRSRPFTHGTDSSKNRGKTCTDRSKSTGDARTQRRRLASISAAKPRVRLLHRDSRRYQRAKRVLGRVHAQANERGRLGDAAGAFLHDLPVEVGRPDLADVRDVLSGDEPFGGHGGLEAFDEVIAHVVRVGTDGGDAKRHVRGSDNLRWVCVFDVFGIRVIGNALA